MPSASTPAPASPCGYNPPVVDTQFLELWASEVDASGRPVPASLEMFLAHRARLPFGWMHAVVVSPEAADDLLRKEFGLPVGTVGDLCAGHMRAGLEQHGGVMAFLVSAPRDTREYVHLGVFFSESALITVAMQPVTSLTELAQAWRDDPEDLGVTCGALLYAVLDALVDDYFPSLDRIHARIEVLEDHVFDGTPFQLAEAICIKRDLLTMRKQVGPLRDTLNALGRYGAPVVLPGDLLRFNDLYNHVLRLTENIDLGRDILSTLMDAQLNVQSNRLNEVLRKLTVISTTLMASSLIAGIYGMNFERMPELTWVYGYPMAIGLMALVTTVVLTVFRCKRYI